MALADIKIYRTWPVINGYVQVPHNKPADKTRVTVDEALSLVAGSEASQLSLGSGKATGSKHGQQEFLRLPPVAADSWYSTNPVDDVAGV